MKLTVLLAAVLCWLAWRRSGYARSQGLLELLRFGIVSLPFGLSLPGLIAQVFKTAGGYPYLSVNAYNAWALVSQNGHGVAADTQWVCDSTVVPSGPVEIRIGDWLLYNAPASTLVMHAITERSGLSFTPIPYKGSAPAITEAQTRRLWLRDGGCTYPGCDAPPAWTDGHHLVHAILLGVVVLIPPPVAGAFPVGHLRVVDPNHAAGMDALGLSNRLQRRRFPGGRLRRQDPVQSRGAADRRSALDKPPPAEFLLHGRTSQE